jgi:hypothetical protein
MTTVRSGLVHINLGFWHAEQSEDACFESKSSAIIGFSAWYSRRERECASSRGLRTGCMARANVDIQRKHSAWSIVNVPSKPRGHGRALEGAGT